VTADEGPLDATLVAALYVEHAEELRRFLLGVLRESATSRGRAPNNICQIGGKRGRTREESRKAWLFRVAFHEALRSAAALRSRQSRS